MIDLEKRVLKLERQNRKLQLTLVAVAALLIAVPLVGAVAPQEIPELVQAQVFESVDENGTTRAVIGAGGYVYFDETGKYRAIVDEAGLFYYDEDGALRAGVNREGFTLYDAEGTVMARVPQ